MNDMNLSFEETAHFHAVIVVRRVHAPLADAWNAWAEQDRVSIWFSPGTEQDLRVDGMYRNDDGDRGIYLEVDPMKRLKFTWEQPDYAPGSFVIVDFLPVSDELTEVRVEHANVSCDDAGDLELGWNWSLDSLCAYAETGRGLPFELWAARRGAVPPADTGGAL